jgi:hypothetical protein
MTNELDIETMLRCWREGEPTASVRREHVLTLMDEVVRLRARLSEARTERNEACVNLVRELLTERDATVAWLRDCADQTPGCRTELWFASDEIEVGAHRRYVVAKAEKAGAT